MLIGEQGEVVRRLVREANDLSPAADAALSRGVGALEEAAEAVARFINDGEILGALIQEATMRFSDGDITGAFAWGKAAYMAHRRFAHGWLGLIPLAVAAGALQQTELVTPVSHRLVPRQIMQFWDKPQPPDDVANLTREWDVRSRPSLHRLIDDSEARRFLARHFDDKVQEAYDIAPHVASQSDLFRLAWLSRHGGIYVDADECWQDDVGRLIPADADFVVNWTGAECPCINNWFFAVRPDHPLLHQQLRMATARVLRARDLGLTLSAWALTGPSVTSMCLLDTVCAAPDADQILAGVRLQTEVVFRQVVSNGWFLNYKQDPALNWRMTPARAP